MTVQVERDFDLRCFFIFEGEDHMIASKLKVGDEIRVVAPSRSLLEVWNNGHHDAMEFWQKEGFYLSYSTHSRELDKYHSSSIGSRIEDLHEAFLDPNVKMIITSLGGFNVNQLLRYLDYELIARNPKKYSSDRDTLRVECKSAVFHADFLLLRLSRFGNSTGSDASS